MENPMSQLLEDWERSTRLLSIDKCDKEGFSSLRDLKTNSSVNQEWPAVRESQEIDIKYVP